MVLNIGLISQRIVLFFWIVGWNTTQTFLDSFHEIFIDLPAFNKHSSTAEEISMLDENVKNLYAERKRWCAYDEASQDFFRRNIYWNYTYLFIQTKT